MMQTLLTLSLLILGRQTSAVIFQNPSNISRDDGGPDIWSSCWHPEVMFGDVSQIGYSMALCMKHKMYANLVSSVDQECLDIGDGVTVINEGSAISPRDIFPLGEGPSSFRSIADAYSFFLSRRGIRWDLSNLYPGLVMKIGPTINGDGVLEFIMDRRLDYHERAKLGPGQQMIRRTILPHLLGFRMNLLSMLPLVFGVLIYVAKNAFIFSKITLIISTLMALKSLFVLQHLHPPSPQYGPVNDFVEHSGASEAVNFIGGPRPKPHGNENLVLQMFTGALPPFRGVNDKPYEDTFRNNRNFAWEK